MWMRLGLVFVTIFFLFVLDSYLRIEGDEQGAGCLFLVGIIASLFTCSWILTGGA